MTGYDNTEGFKGHKYYVCTSLNFTPIYPHHLLSSLNVVQIESYFNLLFLYFILCLLHFSKKQVANLVTTRPSSVTPIPSLLLYVRLCLTIWIVTVRKLDLCESIRESWRIEEKYLKWFLMNIFIQTKEIKEKRWDQGSRSVTKMAAILDWRDIIRYLCRGGCVRARINLYLSFCISMLV